MTIMKNPKLNVSELNLAKCSGLTWKKNLLMESATLKF